MRIVVIEDEVNAYEYLVSLIKRIEPDSTVSAHHESVRSSVNFFENNDDYDLIFMDIQIADGLSFEIFNHVTIKKPVIFTTAYDEYAIDAFKVHSVDYLLKPIHLDDLKNSMQKYHEMYSPQDAVISKDLVNAFTQISRPTKNRCLVKKGGHFEYVNVEDIAFVNSEDSITFLHTNTGSRFIYSKTVEQLFQELDSELFFQVNRSQVVNINAIKEIHPFLNQRLKVILKSQKNDDDGLIVSRQRTTPFKNWVDR